MRTSTGLYKALFFHDRLPGEVCLIILRSVILVNK